MYAKPSLPALPPIVRSMPVPKQTNQCPSILSHGTYTQLHVTMVLCTLVLCIHVQPAVSHYLLMLLQFTRQGRQL